MVIRKEIRRGWAVLLAAGAILAALAALLLWRGLRDDSLDRPSFALTVRCDGASLWEKKESGEVPAGAHTLTLSWQEKKGATVRLLSGGESLGQATLAGGEEKALSVTAAKGAPLSVIVLPEEGAVTAYPASPEDLAPSLEALSRGGDLVCLYRAELGALSLRAPVRLFGDFHLSALTVDTELPGRIVLAPERDFTAHLTVFAPRCSLSLSRVSLSFEEAEAPYYLRVSSVNRAPCFTGFIPVDSEEKLARLFDPASLPRLVSGDTVRVLADLPVRWDLAFDGLLSFDCPASLTTAGGVIRLASRKEGEMRFTRGAGAALSPELFEIEAPFARLSWTGNAPPSLTVAQRLWNVQSYNGQEPDLGGAGTAIPQLTLFAGEEAPAGVTFTAVGNTLVGTVPYNVTEEELAAAAYTLTAKGGSAALEGGVRHGGVVIATDGAGEDRRYRIVLTRQAKNIPAVYLETDDGGEITSRTRYVSGLFAMDPGGSGYEGVSLTHVRIRGRGNSTWKWEKKPYKIHFDEPVSLFGLAAAEEWALFANYADKSLMRNRLALVMAAELSFDYVPTQVLVDVFLNGAYAGVYSLGEHLETGEGRVSVTHNMKEKDCGVFLEVGGVVSGVDVNGMNYFHADPLRFVLIKDPDYNEMTTLQFNFIRDYLTAASEAVKAGEGWEDYVDLDTLVDWMIMTELSFNTDCSWRRSTYMVKDPGEKIKMGTVWDFDLAFGNFSKDVPDYDVWVSTNEEDDYVGVTWSTYLLKDPVFQKAFKARWNAVRDRLLAVALEEIESVYRAVRPSAEENFERWQILGKKVAFERKDTTRYPTYASQIQYLKDFLTNRAAWIDQAVADWDTE